MCVYCNVYTDHLFIMYEIMKFIWLRQSLNFALQTKKTGDSIEGGILSPLSEHLENDDQLNRKNNSTVDDEDVQGIASLFDLPNSYKSKESIDDDIGVNTSSITALFMPKSKELVLDSGVGSSRRLASDTQKD